MLLSQCLPGASERSRVRNLWRKYLLCCKCFICPSFFFRSRLGHHRGCRRGRKVRKCHFISDRNLKRECHYKCVCCYHHQHLFTKKQTQKELLCEFEQMMKSAMMTEAAVRLGQERECWDLNSISRQREPWRVNIPKSADDSTLPYCKDNSPM